MLHTLKRFHKNNECCFESLICWDLGLHLMMNCNHFTKGYFLRQIKGLFYNKIVTDFFTFQGCARGSSRVFAYSLFSKSNIFDSLM